MSDNQREDLTLVTVIGARPQFVKAATVSRVIEQRAGIREVLVHTGQHFDANMSEVFFNELAIPEPGYNLGIGGGSHGAMTGRQLEAIEGVLLDVQPNWVLTYGDTNSTLAGALAAAKLHIPVAHVEAGLRSFNRRMPEEINRVATDHMSDVLFTPTATSRRNLLNEGIPERRISMAGDVMYDAAMFYRERARRPDVLDREGIQDGAFVLCTLHRAENTDDSDRLQGILAGLAMSELPVILPIHPRTRMAIQGRGMDLPLTVITCDPVSYLEMIYLESRARIIATDSGGVQKEAYFHGRPCLTLRDETEWVELVEAGVNRLVSVDPELIGRSLKDFAPNFPEGDIFGRGNAAELVVDTLTSR